MLFRQFISDFGQDHRVLVATRIDRLISFVENRMFTREKLRCYTLKVIFKKKVTKPDLLLATSKILIIQGF